MLKKILMILLFILLFFFLVKDKQSNDYLYKYNGISIDLEKIGNKYILKDNKRNIELIDAKYKKTNEIELKPIEFTKDNESEYLLIFKSLQNIYDYYLNNYNFKKDNIKVIINLDKNNSYAIGSNIIAIGKKEYYLSDSVL